MSYLLDSDVIIDFQKSKEPGSTYFKTAVSQKSFISVISYSEIMYGFLNHAGSEKLNFFENLLKDFNIVLLPIDKNEVVEFTNLKLSLKKSSVLVPDFDLLIAATAKVNNLTLVTRNIKHFSRVPHLKLFPSKTL